MEGTRGPSEKGREPGECTRSDGHLGTTDGISGRDRQYQASK